MNDKLPQEFIPLKSDSIPVNGFVRNIQPPSIPKFEKPIQEVVIKNTPKIGIEGFVERNQGKIALAGLIFAILAIIEAGIIAYLEK